MHAMLTLQEGTQDVGDVDPAPQLGAGVAALHLLNVWRDDLQHMYNSMHRSRVRENESGSDTAQVAAAVPPGGRQAAGLRRPSPLGRSRSGSWRAS